MKDERVGLYPPVIERSRWSSVRLGAALLSLLLPAIRGHADDDSWKINSIVWTANRKAVIAFSYGKNEFACVKAGIDDYTAGDTWTKQNLKRLTPKVLPPQGGILWHGKIYCGNVYHGQGDANQFTNQELIEWIRTCNRQGGVCTLDWPFDSKTGLIKEFGMKEMIEIRDVVKGE